MNNILLMGCPQPFKDPSCCATMPPNHPCHNNNNIPINEGLIFLAIVGFLIVLKYGRRK
jgi:hypothetical protein